MPENKHTYSSYSLIAVIWCVASCLFGKQANAAQRDTLTSHIAAFWAQTKADLATVPMDAVVEPTKEALPYHTYKVTLRGLNGVKFNVMMAIPVQGEAPAKPWPVIVTTCGYGVTAGQGVMLGECQRGYIIMQVFPRGQGMSADLFKIEGDKLTMHAEQPNGAYYQGAYADMIRTIDFAMTRPDVDPNRVAMMATSQGGGICLAVASLDARVKTVVAHVPFLCNMRLAASSTQSLVKTVLDKHKNNIDTYLNTLDYFDPYYLVANLHCPVLMSGGGKDVLCPLATVQSVYDRLKTRKKLKVYPDLPHTTCLDFYKAGWPWLEKYLKN
ncbi:MAG: acetylxylan esterase [Bacteroidota bacterium]